MAGQGMNFSSLEDPSATSIPEAALAVAVLHRAVLDCLTQGVPAPVRRNAYLYLTANDNSWPFSFLNVAEYLSEDPEALRTSIFSFLRKSLGNADLRKFFLGGSRAMHGADVPGNQSVENRLRFHGRTGGT
jgi:hypothetical protein